MSKGHDQYQAETANYDDNSKPNNEFKEEPTLRMRDIEDTYDIPIPMTQP